MLKVPLKVLLILLVAAVAVIFGLEMFQAKAATATLTGVVTAGPNAPVCRIGVSCSSVVSNHTIELADLNGNVIATSQTDSSGKYIFNLVPGEYQVILVPKIGISKLANNKVKVVTGLNTFNIDADTGIR